MIDGIASAGIRAFLTTGALFARSAIPKRVFESARVHVRSPQLGKNGTRVRSKMFTTR
jgi:hypothetical protein